MIGPLPRERHASAIDGLVLVAIALAVLVLFLDEPHVLPRTSASIDLAPSMLPLYATYSVQRMTAAYACALVFSLAAGYWAAASPAGRRLILPALDVLQTVPILGFFPAAVFGFIRLFRGTAAGVEAAAVFLVFTSQAWNMAFSVYESLTTIPDDLRTAVRVSGATGPVLWRRLLLPACVPRLVYNSMLSWAGGWFFLIASEIIAVGRHTWGLPGLGSYIGEAAARGRTGPVVAGVLALVSVVAALQVLVWSPLQAWAGRFRYDTGGAGAPAASPWIGRVLRRAPVLRWTLLQAARLTAGVLGGLAARAFHVLSGRWVPPLLVLAGVSGAGALAWGAAENLALLTRPLPAAAREIPMALLFSFLRILVAYLVCLGWTVPVACWVSRSSRRAALVMPPVQVLASLPATAFFPLLVAAVVHLGWSIDVAAVALVLTGMQWYVLFNLVAAAQAMPEQLRELATTTGARGLVYLRRFFLPMAAPSLVTGSLTAWGGGWNALVLSERVSAAGRTWAVPGIGALLDRATYVEGDLQMIELVVLSMVVAVMLLNRTVWRPLYAWASLRFRLDD